MKFAHSQSVEDVLKSEQVHAQLGLSEKEASIRLSRIGPNAIKKAEQVSWFKLILKQFSDFMVLILIGAAAISFALGEMVDALSIVAIVVLNALFGFFQEFKAEKSLDMLRRMTAPQATVRRNGRPVRISATHIVPGDIVILKEGDRVPADARIISAAALKIDESPLTGESQPTNKDALWTGSNDIELADRKNMIYMGTTVVRGRCEAVIIATGMSTEIGDIAAMIKTTKEGETPLQRRLTQLGKGLVAICIIVVIAVFSIGVLRGFGVMPMFFTGVSLAVAAIPEGLPAVVTIALALGVQRMIRRKAIVRRLPAVETLGCVTVICSDKTGTLTKNEMTVTHLFVGDREASVTGVGYEPVGTITSTDPKRPIDLSDNDFVRALHISALCNDALLVHERRNARQRGGNGKEWRIAGDPTEGALKVLARKAGIDTEQLKDDFPRVGENPFDSERKRMSVFVRDGDRLLSYVKGAPGVLGPLCSHIQIAGRIRPIGAKGRARIDAAAERMAKQQLRVLALAYKPIQSQSIRSGGQTSLHENIAETDLVFVGLIGMMDSPRPEVAFSISKARRAGIDTVMVTGDHPSTAAAIGRHLGIDWSNVITGSRIDQMSDDDLGQALQHTRIFARVSPRHKLRIVKTFKQLGHVVAMTGDGINDAPAVKEADVGVAMGITGTDVTREAASMVLADDHFGTIVAAVEEGRGIYDNVRKFIRYLLACNTGEVLAMLIATIFGFPLPLLPIQILWVNLVTDGLPAIALGVDPPEKDVMERPPRDPKEGIFARGLLKKIMFRGVLIGSCTVAAFLLGLINSPGQVDAIAYARTLALTTLVLSQLIFVFQCRSERLPLHDIPLRGNRWLLVAVGISLIMQLSIVYFPPLQVVFKTVPLAGLDWLFILFFSTWSQLIEMMVTFVRRVWMKHVSLVRV